MDPVANLAPSPPETPSAINPIEQKSIFDFFKNRKVLIVTLSVLALLLAATAALSFYSQKNKQSSSQNQTSSTPTIAPSSNLDLAPIPTDQDENVSISPTSSPKSSANSTPTPVPTPTAIPTKIPNPPQISISYPSEMQSIEMTSGQQFCVVDIPAGGDTSGLKRRHNINDAGWTSYENMFTLCFSPNEGVNRIMLQYKNSYGEESTTYTRQFVFHRI